MIDHEDMRRRIPSQQETVHEHGGFSNDSNSDENEWNNVEGFPAFWLAFAECTPGLDDQFDGDGGHEGAEENYAHGFDTAATDWVFANIGGSSEV